MITKEQLDKAVKTIKHPKDSEEFLKDLVGLLDLHLIFARLVFSHKKIKIHILIGGIMSIHKDVFLEYTGHLKYLLKYLPKKNNYEIRIDNMPKKFKDLL